MTTVDPTVQIAVTVVDLTVQRTVTVSDLTVTMEDPTVQ